MVSCLFNFKIAHSDQTKHFIGSYEHVLRQKCSFRHQKELQEYANLKSSQIKHEGPLLTIDKRNYKKTLPVQDATSPNHSMQFQSHLQYFQLWK